MGDESEKEKERRPFSKGAVNYGLTATDRLLLYAQAEFCVFRLANRGPKLQTAPARCSDPDVNSEGEC